MAIVDAWIQHPTATFVRHPMFESLRRWMGVTEVPSEISLGSTLGALQAANVDHALVCAWHGPEGALITNDEVASFVRSAGGVLFGVASVDLARPMDAVRELRRAVKQLGMCALRVRHTGPMRPSEPGRPIPYLDEVALEFPELVIVGGHIGYPWTDELSLREYMKGHGKKKVLFGSNYPMITPADCLAQLDELGLDEEARRLFLGDNAKRVFRLESTI